ncbi:hypothetical protein L9G16_18470, partial [Shewanella sp. A25]|nr:hypothetical protein [Shewanella shenzhenensis]
VICVVVEMLEGVIQNRLKVFTICLYGMHTTKTGEIGFQYGGLTWSNLAGLGDYEEFIFSFPHSCCAFSSGGFLSVLEVTVLPCEATLSRAVAIIDLILEGVKGWRA